MMPATTPIMLSRLPLRVLSDQRVQAHVRIAQAPLTAQSSPLWPHGHLLKHLCSPRAPEDGTPCSWSEPDSGLAKTITDAMHTYSAILMPPTQNHECAAGDEVK